VAKRLKKATKRRTSVADRIIAIAEREREPIGYGEDGVTREGYQKILRILRDNGL
jgi:hypothetical protein